MVMNFKQYTVIMLSAITIFVFMINDVRSKQKRTCMSLERTVKAKLKSCLLRPDTGPCRADILSWYFDAKQEKCYRFFWGGCQGNGNRYTSRSECFNSCYVNTSLAKAKVPHFCSLAFEYGDCFGHYNRWGWDPILKSCKRRLYSGCGGNQNNFETKMECLATCVTGPNSSLSQMKTFTTCVPFTIPDV